MKMSKEQQVTQLTDYMAKFIAHIAKKLPDDVIEILLKIFSSYLYSHNSIVMKDSENFYHKLS